MDESVLWALAIGIGLLGLVLLAVGTLFAVYWSTARDESSQSPAKSKSQREPVTAPPVSQAGSRAPGTSATPPPRQAASPGTQQPVGGGFLPWVRAWIFAFIHASTVSLVLGGITFFEDLARANDEIQRTGTVSFPKQLLPGTVTGSMVRKSLSEPADGFLEDGASENPATHQPAPDGSVEWEVVDILNESDD